ncbi:MAG: translocation/assembly module TamB domain-containing protein, partial [Mucilaginibacter sp.]
TTGYGKLEGSGVASNLKLNISSLGDFEMFGDFLISTGKFEFIAKNVISKNFQVTQGGTIRWTGDPTNAEINMTATYDVRAPVGPLYAAAGLGAQGNSSQQIAVQADLILTKSLLQPNIDFDFDFPTDPSIKDEVGSYLNDYNNRSQQALSIILRRQFASGTGTNGNSNGDLTQQTLQTAGEAVSELAFNKLNTVLAQSNALKSLDLNIRSLNDASASLRLFKERFVLSGSLYTTTGTGDLFASNSTSLFNSNFNSISKDFNAQYLITKNGNLTAHYAYRLLSGTTLNTLDPNLTSQYVNGVGLAYQRDFDTFREFLRNMFGQGGKRKKQIIPLLVPITTPGNTPGSSTTIKTTEQPEDTEP